MAMNPLEFLRNQDELLSDIIDYVATVVPSSLKYVAGGANANQLPACPTCCVPNIDVE